MTFSTQRRGEATTYLPGRREIVTATIVTAVGWALFVVGLASIVSFLPHLGWTQLLSLVALCGAPPGAMWATQNLRTSWRLRATLPKSLLETRFHGTLDAAVGRESRSLRPIGATADEIAVRTGALLGCLVERPGVRIFHGVRCPTATVAHAVTAGRLVILVESVAWPPGEYEVDGDGRLRCDGHYIGQSVATLMAAVRYWREALPRNHRVIALVIVHGTSLPTGTVADLAWARAEDALVLIGQRVPHRPAVSTRSFAALVAATASG